MRKRNESLQFGLLTFKHTQKNSFFIVERLFILIENLFLCYKSQIYN
jgi:hypothetical protein